MWHAPPGHPLLPDSLEEDDMQLQIVYDASDTEPEPEGPAKTDAGPQFMVPKRGGYAQQSASKPRRRPVQLPSPPGSPPLAHQVGGGSPLGQSSGGTAQIGGHQQQLAQEMQSLLQKTLHAVITQGEVQQPEPWQQHQPLQYEGAEQGAAAPPGTQASNGGPQQEERSQQGAMPAAKALAQRARQPPRHNSPAAPTPGPSLAAPLSGGQDGLRNSGRRWRQPPKPAPQLEALGWPSQRPQQAGRQQHAVLASQSAATQQQQDMEHRPAQSADVALVAAVGPADAGAGGGGFFSIDEDLLAAHMQVPPAAAAPAAGGAGLRQAGKRGKQQQQQQQQQLAQPSQAAAVAGEGQGAFSQQAGAVTTNAGGGLGELLGTQGGGGVAGRGGGTAAGRNPLGVLLDPGAGGKGKGAGKKKQNPIYGTAAGGGGGSNNTPRHPLTSPRQHSRPRFLIKETSVSAPSPSNGRRHADLARAAGGVLQQHQAQHGGSILGMQKLIGRTPGSKLRHPAAEPEDIDSMAWEGKEGGRLWQLPANQPVQPPLQQHHHHHQALEGQPVGDGGTPGQGPLEQQQAQQRGAPLGEGLAHQPPLDAADTTGLCPPPTSYKTPAHSQLRSLFHSGAMPASSMAAMAATAAAAAETASVTPGAAPCTGGSGWPNTGDEGASAGKGGMSLQRQFVAALAPVSRTVMAGRPRGGVGGGGSMGGLYGRLQAVLAAEKAHHAAAAHTGQHGRRVGAWARLSVVERVSEANLTKCICRVVVEGEMVEDRAGAGELAGAVLALFQSRTAREVDLVPGSTVLVRAPWRLIRPPGGEKDRRAGDRLPVMLCHTAVQG